MTSSRPGSDPLGWILFSLMLIATLAIFALAELVLHVMLPTNQPYVDALLADHYADYRPWSAHVTPFV